VPEKFLGIRHHFFGNKKDGIEVESIDGFSKWFGWKHAPEKPRDSFKRRGRDTLVDKESRLYFMKHGPVCCDPLGVFTARKAEFAHYPREVRYKLMAEMCLGIWAIVDCVTNEPSGGNDKVVWTLVIVLTQWIGVLIYHFAPRTQRIEQYGH
jgi:hypothetical protein